MTTLRSAAQQALEALYEETAWFGPTPKGAAAITALRAALAQQHEPVQEPVGWMYPDDYAGILKHQSRAEVFQKAWCNPAVCVPLYTAPPQRKPLTDEEIEQLLSKYERNYDMVNFARAIERAHGIK